MLILHGQAPIDEVQVDEATKALLTHLQGKMTSMTTSHPLIYKEHKNGIKKQPEKMTILPSGCHLGIYKSLQQHILKTDDKDQIPPDNPNETIKQGRDALYLIFDVIALTLKHTYTLKQWHVIWTMFIEKELGNPNLARL